MTFLALLTKELRLRMRRERTVWVIITYILLMGLLGWFVIGSFSATNNSNPYALGQMGTYLYTLFSQLQLVLVMFITPAFTSTSINGEKERQTFDLLLCSRLSSFALVSGKLVAGLMNALLLIAASIPLFSLVFFFGGISPVQLLQAMLLFIITAMMVGTCGLLFSSILTRPAASTAITYATGLIWLVTPIILYFIAQLSRNFGNGNQPPLIFIWNPIIALISTYPSGTFFTYTIGSWHIVAWQGYTVLSIVATAIFFWLSMLTIKPNTTNRPHTRRQTPSVTNVTATV